MNLTKKQGDRGPVLLSHFRLTLRKGDKGSTGDGSICENVPIRNHYIAYGMVPCDTSVVAL